jgi:hypothetical protein
MQPAAPIVCVWLGSELPKKYIQFLEFNKKSNPNSPIYLVIDTPSFHTLANTSFESYIISSLSSTQKDLASLQEYGDFWLYTSLRFFALKVFCREFQINSFFHLELDNVVGCLEGLDQRLSSLGSGIFAPQDSPDRVIASLIFCNDLDSLDDLASIYVTNKVENDMVALSIYAKSNATKFFALPTESYERNKGSYSILSPFQTGGIFDAASIGQYLFGIDPLHSRYSPLKNMFINENCKYDWSRPGSFYVSDSTLFINIGKHRVLEQKWQRVYNIHVHSKNIKAVNKFFAKHIIYKDLLRGKPSVIQNHHLFVFGLLLRLADYSIVCLKSVWKAAVTFSLRLKNVP